MFLLSLLAVAAGPPQPDPSLSGILAANDYPSWAVGARVQGAVGFELLVGPNGKVQRCTVLVSSGHKMLDSYTCGLVQRRAAFEPVTDDQGHAVYGLYRGSIDWVLNYPGQPQRLAPDLDLTVNRAPVGMSLPVDFQIYYLSSPAGAVNGCRVLEHGKKAAPELVDLACRSIAGSGGMIVHDLKGAAVEGWVVSSVRVSLDPRNLPAASAGPAVH